MSMDSQDFKNRNKHYCPECNEELHPETEQWSIAHVNDSEVKCEVCEEIDFDALVDRVFEGVPV